MFSKYVLDWTTVCLHIIIIMPQWQVRFWTYFVLRANVLYHTTLAQSMSGNLRQTWAGSRDQNCNPGKNLPNPSVRIRARAKPAAGEYLSLSLSLVGHGMVHRQEGIRRWWAGRVQVREDATAPAAETEEAASIP